MNLSKVACLSVENNTWQKMSDCLFNDEIAVFRYCLSDSFATVPWNTFLETDELARAYRYHHKSDRLRFLYARSLLRLVSAKYTQRPLIDIHFGAGASKKPEIIGGTGWHINVSHSGKWVLLAFSRDHVGVDIEEIKPAFAWHDIADFSFSQREQKSLADSEAASLLFYRLWTRKEALLKATGKGVDEALARVPALDGHHAVPEDVLGMSGDWSVISFATAEGYSSAVTYRSGLKLPKFYTVESGFLTSFAS